MTISEDGGLTDGIKGAITSEIDFSTDKVPSNKAVNENFAQIRSLDNLERSFFNIVDLSELNPLTDNFSQLESSYVRIDRIIITNNNISHYSVATYEIQNEDRSIDAILVCDFINQGTENLPISYWDSEDKFLFAHDKELIQPAAPSQSVVRLILRTDKNVAKIKLSGVANSQKIYRIKIEDIKAKIPDEINNLKSINSVLGNTALLNNYTSILDCLQTQTNCYLTDKGAVASFGSGSNVDFYKVSDFVDCTDFISVKVKTEVGGSQAVICWYDKNKKFISSLFPNLTSNTYLEYFSTRPYNASFVRFCFQTKKNEYDVSVAYEQGSLIEFIDKKEKGYSKWNNKKIAFLGDSMTANGEYVNPYKNLTNCEVLNYGLGGSHIAKVSKNDGNAFESRVDNMSSEAQMVIVFGGTNDFGHSSTADFGEFTDGYNADKITFYAGLHRLCKALYEKFRGKPIVIMTPIHHGYKVDNPEYKWNNGTLIEETNPKSGKTFKEYVNAIKEVAQFYSFELLDAYSFSGLNPMLETDTNYYFYDGLHLSSSGSQRLAKWMYPQLEEIYNKFY